MKFVRISGRLGGAEIRWSETPPRERAPGARVRLAADPGSAVALADEV